MGSIRDRNGMDLTEGEDIKKRCTLLCRVHHEKHWAGWSTGWNQYFWEKYQEYTEELYKKDLHNRDYHDGVVTNLEPDILESEVKWALESITTNKAVEVMEFQLIYFKSWKMMLWKCCTPYVSNFGKLSSGHRVGKGQFLFQSQSMAMPKNVQTTTQLHSFHMLTR